MSVRFGTAGVVTLLIGLAACASDPDPAPPAASPSATPAPSAPSTPPPTSTPSATPTEAAAFPTSAFAGISAKPVPKDLAARLQTALATHDVTSGGGMSATVMTADGTWSGTTGTADGVRDLRIDDQFTIASLTKSVVATQVMLMVEAGELALDDPVADHLPRGLGFDTSGATIRQVMGHRSGLPDYYELGDLATIEDDPQRVWTTPELLELVPAERTPPGDNMFYSETNYLLLKLVIEHLRGRPLAAVLRRGALAVKGLERLVLQPDERPSEPMALPAGQPHSVAENSGEFVPSLANATAYTASGGIASDSPTLARWWRALCTGDIISRGSLTEMSAFEPAPYIDSYGLGAYNPAHGYAEGFGHTGQLPGYMTWAGCLPEEEAVIVVLSNHEVADGHLAWSHGLARPLVEALRAP
jgi:D-alanyl-D-alanine carboxypeptidase